MNLILSYEQHVVSCIENIPESIGLEELNRDQLFIAIKKNRKEIIESVQQFARLAPEFNIRHFHFSYNPTVKKMILKESKFNADVPTPSESTSRGTVEKGGNVGTESPIPTISKESKKMAGNVGTESTIPTIFKESKKMASNVGTESPITTISKESKEMARNVEAESPIPTISKESKKKAGNVGTESPIPTISKESKKKADNVGAVTTTSPTCQCKDKVEKDNSFRKESPTIICVVTSFVNVESSEDSNDCCISGIVVVSQTQLVLADFGNKCLKLVNMKKKEMIKRPLTPSPRDVTLIPQSQVAVSLPDLEEIQIFTADQNLDFCKSLYVAGRCHGLDCSGDKIVVSFTRPIMIQILDLMGNVLKTIQQDSSDKMLLCVPSYLTIRPDHKRIYISDQNKNTITCMDSEETVHWVYKDKEMVNPNGVAIGESGHLYIGSKNNHTIHVVSPEGVRIAIIPVSQCGVHYPRTVCYSNYGQMLYISSNKVAKVT